jgi:hypothetical protein
VGLSVNIGKLQEFSRNKNQIKKHVDIHGQPHLSQIHSIIKNYDGVGESKREIKFRLQ